MVKDMMTRIAAIILFVCVASYAEASAEEPVEANQNWAQWRGPSANGTSSFADPPVEWDESRNIRWKIDIPGMGHASPIVWGDQVFILSAVETDVVGDAKPAGRRRGPPTVDTRHVHRFVIFAIDRKTGKINWQRTAHEAIPHESTHPTGSWASGSPSTDGEYVYATFGSQGLYCYTLEGDLKWKTDLGDMRIKLGFGEGSSPALFGNQIVITWDHVVDQIRIAVGIDHRHSGDLQLAGFVDRDLLLVGVDHT